MKRLSLVAALVFAGSAHADLIGVTWSGSVYDINSATGVGVFLALSGYTNLNSLASSPDGIYTVGGSSSQTLLKINPDTGLATALFSIGASDIRGLAFVGSDLYAIQQGATDQLIKINPTNGVVTPIGSTNYVSVQSLEYDGTTLFAWDIDNGLLSINPATGAATYIGGFANQDIQGLVSLPGGRLLGGRDRLYEIDKTTGNLSLIGSGNYTDVRGLARRAVPEPMSVAALAIGISLALSRRRR